jgi:hypothetical protein
MNKYLKGHQSVFFWLSALVLFICIFIYINWQNKQRDRKILQYPAFSVGHFTQLKVSKGSGLEGYFTFDVGGISYNSANLDGRYRNLGKRIFDQSFPVIYDSMDLEVNQILVFPTDFSEFGLPFPDSLRWVEEAD